MSNYCIYKHIFPNNKVYIGITSVNPIKRWCNRYKEQPFMHNAIVKYGWDNIRHEILFTDLCKEEAEQKEVELIKQFMSNNKEFGYNIANGGMHFGKHSAQTKKLIGEKGRGIKRSEAFKQNLRELHKSGVFPKPPLATGKTPWNKGLKTGARSDETKRKISAKNKGRIVSQECREKLSKALKGRPRIFR
jgi:hypothetical protein